MCTFVVAPLVLLMWLFVFGEQLAVGYLRQLKDCPTQGVDENNFSDHFEQEFVTNDSSGQAVEVQEGGSDIPVDFNNRVDFAEKYKFLLFILLLTTYPLFIYPPIVLLTGKCMGEH